MAAASHSTLIYDGDCSFCLMWVSYGRMVARKDTEWIASQELGERFAEISRDDFKRAVVLVNSDGSVQKGAAAIFGVLAQSPRHGGWLKAYRGVPGFAAIAEGFYKLVAANRNAAFHLTRLLYGRTIRPLEYGITESLFLRLLGLVFLFAFWSLGPQMLGLAGSHGIIPVAGVMAAMREQLGPRGFLVAPGVFWFESSDAMIRMVPWLGIGFSLLLLFGGWVHAWLQRIAIAACYLLYLSLVMAGQPFTSFQWDALLLESAFLALFAGTPLMVWAARVLVFKLMFQSGCVKLLSGDPNWRDLHALRYHFMTQPLPNPLAWYVYQAPGWLLDVFTLLTLVVELACPFLLFLPRRARHFGALALIGFQVLIMLTGNYAFFNLLTIALCLLAFDDWTFARLRSVLRSSVTVVQAGISRSVCTVGLAVVMLLSAAQVVNLFAPSVAAPLARLQTAVAPWQIVNSYGLFAVMTTTRPELIYEGSNDGEMWEEYSFPYKPGDVTRGLPVVAPFQPRLDWQLWFAALDGNYAEDTWTGNVVVRLLQGEPSVSRLLRQPPFATPPKFIRVSLYEYWFTDERTREKTGAIWARRFSRRYLPPISLDQLRREGP
jgi:predicted DCC family thiol-disulfide oxidoreductase YuxK